MNLANYPCGTWTRVIEILRGVVVLTRTQRGAWEFPDLEMVYFQDLNGSKYYRDACISKSTQQRELTARYDVGDSHDMS